MDCRDCERLLAARPPLTRYAAAVLAWHVTRCPRCAAAARGRVPGPSPLPRAYWGSSQSKGTYV
ncbi:MAG: hypothetical protein L6Q95_18890 [Planctomycetes bacterium]|nr:hypothetical protein [Planctomycetota bacterium]